MEDKKAMKSTKIGIGKFWAWQSRGASVAIGFIIMGFALFFLTDTIGMPAGTAGVILMTVGILEAFVDLLSGLLVDRTKTKFGVGRPFELFIIILWISIWMVFSVPGEASNLVIGIWVFTSMLVARGTFAILGASQNAFLIRVFETREEQVRVLSFGGFVIMLASIIFSISFPILLSAIATTAAGWSRLIMMFGLPLMFIGLIRFLAVKETVEVKGMAAERANIKDIGILLRKNPYIYMVAFLWLSHQLVIGMGVGPFFYEWVTGDIGNMGIAGMIGIPLIPLLFAFPKFLKKYSTSTLIVIGSICYVISGIFFFISNGQMSIVMVALVFAGLGAMPVSYLTDVLLIECGTYNLHRNKQRMDGTIAAFRTFVGNAGSAIGAGVFGILLGMSGFDGTLSTQPESAIFFIRATMGLLPIIVFGLVTVIFIKFYKIDQDIKKMEEEAGM